MLFGGGAALGPGFQDHELDEFPGASLAFPNVLASNISLICFSALMFHLTVLSGLPVGDHPINFWIPKLSSYAHRAYGSASFS